MENTPVVKTSEWVVTFIVAAIPIVGFIMLFVWAFGSGSNPNKANWAKAALIIAAVFVVLYLLLFLVFGLSFLSSMAG
jgi:hypothetical protein